MFNAKATLFPSFCPCHFLQVSYVAFHFLMHCPHWLEAIGFKPKTFLSTPLETGQMNYTATQSLFLVVIILDPEQLATSSCACYSNTLTQWWGCLDGAISSQSQWCLNKAALKTLQSYYEQLQKAFGKKEIWKLSLQLQLSVSGIFVQSSI